MAAATTRVLNNDDNGRFYGEREREFAKQNQNGDVRQTFCNFATGFLSSALITQYLQLRLDFFFNPERNGKNLEAAPSEDLLKKQHRKW